MQIDHRFHVKVRAELAREMSLTSLLGKKVEVRGWLSQNKKQPQLWLQHAANLSVVGR